MTISDTTSSAAPTACKADGVALKTTGTNGDKVDIAVNANISVNGEYTATVKAVSNQANITGSATVTFNKVAEVVTDFQYNGNAFPSSMNVDLSKPVTAYDESLIEVFDTAGTELSTKDYDIWYTTRTVTRPAPPTSGPSAPGRSTSASTPSAPTTPSAATRTPSPSR